MKKLALLATILLTTSAHAQLETEQKGVLLVHVHGFNDDADPQTVYTASKGSKFQVLNCSSGKCTVRFSKVGNKKSAVAHCTKWAQAVKPSQPPRCNHVSMSTNYDVLAIYLNSYDYREASGVVLGPLMVPFKLQLKDMTLKAGGSIGAAVGYRWVFTENLSLSPLASAGLSVIRIEEDTETKPAFTASVGAVFGIKDFQVGAVLGMDFAVEEYKYRNRPWLSLAIGYNFF